MLLADPGVLVWLPIHSPWRFAQIYWSHIFFFAHIVGAAHYTVAVIAHSDNQRSAEITRFSNFYHRELLLFFPTNGCGSGASCCSHNKV